MIKLKSLLVAFALLVGGASFGALPTPSLIVGVNLDAIKNSKFLASIKALAEKNQTPQNLSQTMDDLMFAKSLEIYQLPGDIVLAKVIKPTVTPEALTKRGIPSRVLNGRTVFEINTANGNMLFTFVTSDLAVCAPEAMLEQFIKEHNSLTLGPLYKLYSSLPASAMVSCASAFTGPIQEIVAIINDKNENLQLLANVKCNSTESGQVMEFQVVPIFSMLIGTIGGGDMDLAKSLQRGLTVSRNDKIVIIDFELSPAQVEKIANAQIKKWQKNPNSSDTGSLLIK